MMELEPNYEKLRKILSPVFGARLPKNELTDKLLRAMFPEEEARIIAKGIKRGIWPTTVRRIRKRSGISKEEAKKVIKEMEYKGKIVKYGPFCIILPYIPGTFEMYFTAKRDDPNKLKEAAEAHYALVKSGFHVKDMKGKYPFIRVIPSSKPVERIIEVEKTIEVKHKVLPFEVLKKYLSKKKVFAVHRCSCRTAAELAGNPCKRTDENFCITAGLVAKHVLREGVGEKVNLEELLKIMKRAEKKGLVHQAINVKASSIFVCQCCPCCCAALKPTHDIQDKDILGTSNFIPEVDEEKCEFCKTCIKQCPMETIHEKDEKSIEINLDNCIGCGVCANNCPYEAIKLVKTGNKKTLKRHIRILLKSRRRKEK